MFFNHIINTRRFIIGIMLFGSAIASTNIAHAHFIWAYSEDGKIKVVFGEGLEPDQAEFLNGLSGMSTFAVRDGELTKITMSKKIDGDEGWFETPLSDSAHAVDVSCEYGVFNRGDKSMYLDYSAKYINLANYSASEPTGKLSLDLVPELKDGKILLKAYFMGQPAEDVEIQLSRKASETVTQNTDSLGIVSLHPSARYQIRAKHIIAEAGEIEGQAFSEKRYYCTLVLDVDDSTLITQTALNANDSTPSFRLKKVSTELADFPRGMTSFGATVVDSQIFVIGGKSGKAHSYAKSYQNRNVYCLNVKNVTGEDSSHDNRSSDWQTVGDNLGLQGLAIVGHEGKVYRIGGLEARNQEGDEHDLHSSDEFLMFDPASKSWTEMPNLPEARSSFDACVVDNKIYVAGGWAIDGNEKTTWATDVLVFDLNQSNSKWERIEAPFRTRALAVRCHQGKLFAMGGIQEKGGPTAAVHVFDLKTQQWSSGPEIPDLGKMQAFGCSAVNVGQSLLVSTYDGGVFRLSDDSSRWVAIHQLENGRFFHQMLPIGDTRFAMVGGSHMENGSQTEVEVFQITKSQSQDTGQ